ncbi:MAG: hypothetical protein E7218_08025, partial [Anaerofustis stercorihominis]|nr:hypothetical protein [Anaerofustis stercorihominis]
VAETGWAKCAWGKLYGQWICGSAVLVYDMERFVPEKLLDVMEKYPITTFCAPPTIFRFLIRCNMMYRDLSHIRDCTTAGEALNSEVYRIWLEKTGLKIREGFGQSESVIIAGTFKWMEPVPGSLGKPNPLFRLQLISDKGTEAEPGEEGQISILLKDGRATGLFIGYYGDEARTERTFADDIYYTGDLASVDKDGYLWYVGRADDVIKTSGYRVGPFEVESALMKHQSVLECAITGVPDEVRGQVIKASIVLNKGFTPSEELKKEIQDFVKQLTAPYKYPRVIEFLDELPKTTSGKVQRYVLRKGEEEKKTDKQSPESSRSMAEDWNRTVRELPSFLAKLFESHGFGKGSTVFDCSDNAVMGLMDAGYDVSVAKPRPNEAARISMQGFGFKEEIFRRLSDVQGDEFDIIISMDNTLTHMPSKWDLSDVIEGISSRLGPKGMFVASIRDYDEPTTATTPFVQNTKNGQKIAFQTWTRTDNNYTLVQYIIEDGKELNINKVEYKYRAITREEMTSVLQDNGFEDVIWQMPADTGFYQPMVIALK